MGDCPLARNGLSQSITKQSRFTLKRAVRRSFSFKAATLFDVLLFRQTQPASRQISFHLRYQQQIIHRDSYFSTIASFLTQLFTPLQRLRSAQKLLLLLICFGDTRGRLDSSSLLQVSTSTLFAFPFFFPSTNVKNTATSPQSRCFFPNCSGHCQSMSSTPSNPAPFFPCNSR
jgi:hypothetical protein